MWYIHDRHTGKWWQGINTPEAWGEFVTACGFADSVNALPVAASLRRKYKSDTMVCRYVSGPGSPVDPGERQPVVVRADPAQRTDGYNEYGRVGPPGGCGCQLCKSKHDRGVNRV